MRTFTIGQLEAESGTSRSTIYYYVRVGLLPGAQKSSPSRAIYTDDHLELLGEIRTLKDEGLELEAIRARLAHRVRSAGENGEDLVARQAEDMRRAILMTAARQFARQGYRQTRIADIIAELRITPQVLYGHFATKRSLFAACYGVYLEAMMSFVEPKIEDDDDPAVHLLWRMCANYGLDEFSPDLLTLAREEATDDPEKTRDLVTLHESMLARPAADLARLRQSPESPPLNDELVTYALFGAFQTLRMRVSWDDRFSRRDVMWTELAIFSAVTALYTGALDAAELRDRYKDLIDKVARLTPPLPPGFETPTPADKGRANERHPDRP